MEEQRQVIKTLTSYEACLDSHDGGCLARVSRAALTL